MKTITKLKSKVMRTAWEISRTTKKDFSFCLKKAWEIIKQSFAKINLVSIVPMKKNELPAFCKSASIRIEKTTKEINKEMVTNIVWYVNHIKSNVEFEKIKEVETRRVAEIRANHDAIRSESLIYGYSLD